MWVALVKFIYKSLFYIRLKMLQCAKINLTLKAYYINREVNNYELQRSTKKC
jgi:hypothetical protein